MKIAKFCLLMLMVWATNVSSATARLDINAHNTLPTYTAKYKVFWHGIRVGTSLHTLIKLHNNTYVAETSTQPITSWLPFAYTERSEFNIDAAKINIKPKKYQLDKIEKGRTKHQALNFNWQRKQVIDANSGQALYPLQTDYQDQISHIFQLQLDLRKQFSANDFNHLNSATINYNFKFLGEEIINTPLGALVALKLAQSSVDSNRTTIIWLAKRLDYLIVQSKQYKHNKLIAELNLEELDS